MNEMGRGGGWGCQETDGRFCWCVSTVRDSPPANETSEDMEEPMAVPEDLSASSAHQQNNRGEKGTGTCTSASQKCQTMLQSVKICQSGSKNGVSIPRAPKKMFEDVTTKCMTCVQMAIMYYYLKSYTPSGRYLIDILNPFGKIHIKKGGKKITKRYI